MRSRNCTCAHQEQRQQSHCIDTIAVPQVLLQPCNCRYHTPSDPHTTCCSQLLAVCHTNVEHWSDVIAMSSSTRPGVMAPPV
jgi:hypothetical protein